VTTKTKSSPSSASDTSEQTTTSAPTTTNNQEQVQETTTSTAPSTENSSAPIADAGPNETVKEGTKDFSLNGTGSKDPDGGSVEKYIWKQTDGPEVKLDTTSDPGYAIFDVPKVQEGEDKTQLKFKLTVQDDEGVKSKKGDSVTVTVLRDANSGDDSSRVDNSNLDGNQTSSFENSSSTTTAETTDFRESNSTSSTPPK
jgi:hypothetical protein